MTNFHRCKEKYELGLWYSCVASKNNKLIDMCIDDICSALRTCLLPLGAKQFIPPHILYHRKCYIESWERSIVACCRVISNIMTIMPHGHNFQPIARNHITRPLWFLAWCIHTVITLEHITLGIPVDIIFVFHVYIMTRIIRNHNPDFLAMLKYDLKKRFFRYFPYFA